MAADWHCLTRPSLQEAVFYSVLRSFVAHRDFVLHTLDAWHGIGGCNLDYAEPSHVVRATDCFNSQDRFFVFDFATGSCVFAGKELLSSRFDVGLEGWA
jgi:hypothetical protein